MYPSKILFNLLLCSILLTCGEVYNPLEKDLKIISNSKNNSFINSETLSLQIQNKKEIQIDSVHYVLDGNRIQNELKLFQQKLGKHIIEATVYSGEKTGNLTEEITILNSQTPIVFGFTIINQFPHDINAYTQGLEFYDGELYESTGQYGKSELRKVDYKSGEILKRIALDKSYFGEGITILNGNIYQLTWQENTGFVYDIETFERKGSFKYNQSKEGWGLCNNGINIYKSDGTEKIWRLDLETLTEHDHIQAYHNKGKTIGLNELEWIDGKIFSNRYQLNGVAIINPENGAIEGVIDFSSLREKVKQHAALDVLNGIAYNPESKTIFVTGKYWDTLFEVELVKK